MKKLYQKIVCLSVVSVVTILFATQSFAEIRNLRKDFIRIAILKNMDRFGISVRGKYSLFDQKDNYLLMEGRKLKKRQVYPTKEGIVIGDEEFLSSHIKLVAKKDVTLYVNNQKQRFRGEIDIIKNQKGKLLVINSLDLERYVKGVLYHEVPHRWPLEALKTQAIVARTYALYRMKNHADQLFDVTSDIYSQVYGGKDAERYRTNIAVDRTKGRVLTFDSQILPAYYHANSGGHTEDVSELWKEDLAPLKGVQDRFAQKAPHYTWKKNFQSSEIQKQLNNKGVRIGDIKDISVVERNRSNRIRKLKITARNGQTKTITGKKFRQMIGPNVIKSNNYDITMKGYYFDLVGRGWGHGVGMCQWGAYNMSKEKYKHDEILDFYYPGANLEKLSDVREAAILVDVEHLRKLREEGKI